jgi:toxin ParE1/3/4
MPSFALSSLARIDLGQIARYTQATWGDQQAQKYLHDLQAAFQLVADRPALGRRMTESTSGRRIEHGSHVIFYRETAEGVFIRRILHKAMLPRRHAL